MALLAVMLTGLLPDGGGGMVARTPGADPGI